MKFTKEFLQKIPKTDLHLHLDGSLRLDTLIALSKEYKIELPSYTESGLRELVFKEQYKDLGEYLQGFSYTTAVLQTKEALQQVAYELAWDNINEGVFYIEVRFAPQLHINKNLKIEDVLEAVNNGLKKAKQEFNDTKEVQTGEKPAFHYGIIVCALRMFTKEFSYYYNQLIETHRYSNLHRVHDLYSLASLELIKSAYYIKNDRNIPIVGFDLAGQEDGYPASQHYEAYAFAHSHFIKKTVHAGEAYGAESIFQAITLLHANRIGHGFYLFDKDKIENPEIKDKEKYIYELANYIATSRITIEVCLTSNMQTNPNLKNIKDHSLKEMLKQGLSVSLCTDNRLVSNTTVTKEVQYAVDNFDISPKRLKNIIIYGFKRNFFPGPYAKQRQYCRQIIDYYEKIEKEIGISD